MTRRDIFLAHRTVRFPPRDLERPRRPIRSLANCILEAGCSWVPRWWSGSKNIAGSPGARGQESIFTEVTSASICPKNTSSADRFTWALRSIRKCCHSPSKSSATRCWGLRQADIPHGDRLYGVVDVFLKRNDISESKRKLLVDNTVRFYGLTK